MTRNYNDYIPPTKEKSLERTPNGRLRLTERGKILITTVVFVACLVGAVVCAGFVITQQQHQLERSNQIIQNLNK